MINSKIILDSVNLYGNRLTSYVLTYPRLILAEFNTHRVFSRNSASSRAIPVNKIINSVIENPFVPNYWGKNQKGMQANEELNLEISLKCDEKWLEARDNAVNSAKKLLELGVHKQIANRLLEPFYYITTIITATDFENFFSLRAHKDAQPEFKVLAEKMLEDYNQSMPKFLQNDEWHMPFTSENFDCTEAQKLKIATARCARVSYLNFEGIIDYEKDYELHDDLLISGHLSPFEHCAKPKKGRWGNFNGWLQYRKIFKGENRKDERVIRPYQ